MASLKKNIVANMVGKIWSALIAIILIPQYIKFLGIESYGLVGFFSMLIGSMAVLDLGLSTTLNRELAKFKSEEGNTVNIRNLTFSLECIYWTIGLFISILVVSLSGLISLHWIKVEQLSVSSVRQSVMLMGLVVAFQWPISLYSGGLTGLEKQILNNTVTVIMTTLRAAGVIIVLKYFSPTVQAFFSWQAALTFLYVLIMRWSLWRSMPSHHLKPAFSRTQIKIIWRFAAGMTMISLITFFLAQIDKIVLSKILPLSQFGYYTLAFTIATSITLVVSPMSITFFPRFTNLIIKGDEQQLVRLYHQSCKLIASFIFPICFILIFFTKDILRIWTHNETTTANTYLIAQILIAGSILNSLMVMPYNLLIAKGWTKFTIYQNTIAGIILVPMLFVLTYYFGAIGAATVWFIVNLGYVIISQPLMHQKVLKNELWKWYWNDTFVPMIPALLIVLLMKYLMVQTFPNLQINLLIICIIFSITMTISLLSFSEARKLLTKTVQNIMSNGRQI